MDQGFATLAARMGDFLRVSQDGYAIFTADDILQGCNQAFADILYLDSDKIIGKSFDELYRQVFKNQQGPKIDTLDIDGWLLESSKKRRSREFRLFEIDLVDGRWFLISEQTLSNGDLLLQAKNITKQKMLEQDLHKHTTQLTNIASTDELTQISNRRCLINQIKVELKRCAREAQSAVFCLLDIDFFKKVNDEYGHVVGDKVLLKMARIITSLLREYDPFGRIGGEEFGIFLPNTSLQQAKEITQRLCDTINASQFNTSSKPISISVSIGIVQCWQGATFESLYSCADVALYEAKDKGRNQVAVHSNSLSSLDPG